MRIAVYILSLFLFLSISLFAQNDILRIESVSSPEFVLKGNKFAVSSKVVSNNSTDEIELYLHTDLEISLLSAELKSPSLQKLMKFYRVEADDTPFEKVYKMESGDISSIDEKVWQLECELSASSEKSLNLFVGSSEVYPETFVDENLVSEIKFYKESSFAGKCLELKPQSELSFPVTFNKNQYDRILIEFWSKLNLEQSSFLSIEDNLENELTHFAVSDFGYITSSDLLDAKYFSEFFVDASSWNYYLVELNIKTGDVKLIINNTPFFEGVVSSLIDKEELQLVLGNNSENQSGLVDRLKIWLLGNSIQLALENKNFNGYSADSSEVIYQNNFDSDNFLDELTYTGKLNLVNSTAPIFSQAPSLNVILYGQSYQLSWAISELAKVQQFEVEKSYNGRDFTHVANIQVSDMDKKFYSVSDVDYSDNQIIYYRIKQINKDGSSIYSSDAKVGRGKIKHFTLDQNYPNPFNPITTISIEVKRADQFEVLVYDIVGKTVATLHNGPLGEGIHRFNFDGTDFPSGLYLCEIKSGDEIEVMKMILAK